MPVRALPAVPAPILAVGSGLSCGSGKAARALLSLLLLAGLVPAAGARDRKPKPVKPAPDLIAEGKVVSHANQPLAGAVVYLEDPKSLAIKSYLTDTSGQFHFRRLSPQTDYEVWAEQNGQQSKHKFISQFSSHVHFVFTLKLDPKDKKKFLGL